MSAQDAQRDQLQVYWEVVGDAVAALRSAESRDTYASISLEELIQKQIERLSNSEDASRLDRLSVVTRITTRLTERITALKEIPPSHFQRRSTEDDVLTGVDP